MQGVLLPVLPEAHGDEDDEDEDHAAQDAAHDQVQGVATAAGAAGRAGAADALRGTRGGAQVPRWVFGCSGRAFHWVGSKTSAGTVVKCISFIMKIISTALDTSSNQQGSKLILKTDNIKTIG